MTSVPDVVLASLNCHGGRDAHGDPFDLPAACRLLTADIITLQECWHANGQADPLAVAAAGLGARVLRADLLTGVGLDQLHIAADPRPGRFGLAVISALPVAGTELFPLGPGPGDLTPRAAQLVTLRTGGGLLRVVNTHLTHKFTSPLQLLRLARRLAAGTVPTVIVGDLNMPGPVTGLAAGYQQAVTGRTFPAHRPLVQLDHVLTGPGVTGRGGEVLAPCGSDHRPVRVRLRLAPGTPRGRPPRAGTPGG